MEKPKMRAQGKIRQAAAMEAKAAELVPAQGINKVGFSFTNSVIELYKYIINKIDAKCEDWT